MADHCTVSPQEVQLLVYCALMDFLLRACKAVKGSKSQLLRIETESRDEIFSEVFQFSFIQKLIRTTAVP